MGVETVIVCSPPDVTVFLDNKELAPTSYGRYVIPHLSRQPHLLRVQRAGFADTIERLDFPMTSLHEWVNIKLVPHRQTRPSRALKAIVTKEKPALKHRPVSLEFSDQFSRSEKCFNPACCPDCFGFCCGHRARVVADHHIIANLLFRLLRYQVRLPHAR